MEFNKSSIDHFMYLIGKEYKKQNKHNNQKAEIVIIGGASMLLNYGFREITTDIDAIISHNIKDIANKIGDNYELPTGWLNEDFKNTSSYSPNLIECSHFYKTFYGCLNVRTIKDEYLIAMKLRSFKEYKHDLSDIVGILKEFKETGIEITFEQINQAYQKLYNCDLNKKSEIFIKKILDIKDIEELEDLYYETINEEKLNKDAVILAE